MSGRWVDCASQAEVDAAIAAGDFPVVRSGFFYASGSATVRAYDSATVTAYGSATVRAYGSATVRASGSATVTASGSATVRASGSATVRGAKFTVVHKFSKHTKVTGEATVITPPDLTTASAQTWLGYYGIEPAAEKGWVVVYKGVNKELRSSHGTDYPIGETVTAPDFEKAKRCGNGLHFSPRPHNTLDYAHDATRFLACRVRASQIVVLGDKIKAPSCVVMHEVDLDGRAL